MQSDDRFFVVALNPEPWAVGPLGVGRRGKNAYAYLGENQKLAAYQSALREELEGAGVLSGEVEVTLYIWRKLETAKVICGRDRKAKTSDATNIQKATEDALQGVLIENDRNVRKICTEIVEQNDTTEPCIVVRVKPYEPLNPDSIPDLVWRDVDRIRYGKEEPLLPWDDPRSSPIDDIRDIVSRGRDKWSANEEDLF